MAYCLGSVRNLFYVPKQVWNFWISWHLPWLLATSMDEISVIHTLRQLLCLNHRSEHTVPLLSKPYFSIYFTSPDYPIYCKDGISSNFCLGLVFTSPIWCFKHHLFLFGCFEAQLSFLPIWSWKTSGILLTFIVRYQCYDRCTPFSVIFFFNRSFLL